MQPIIVNDRFHLSRVYVGNTWWIFIVDTFDKKEIRVEVNELRTLLVGLTDVLTQCRSEK